MKVKEIYKIVPTDGGWRVLPNGNYVKLGNFVTLGSYVKLGDGVAIGKYVKLDFTPWQVVGTRYGVWYAGRPGFIRSGCIEKPAKWWLENVERCAEEHGYTTIQQREYRGHIEACVAWMKLYGLMESK